MDLQVVSADKMILQVSDALSFMRNQIIEESIELLSKVKIADGRKQIDGYWNEFQGLKETFEADWKNLDDQLTKMFTNLQVSFYDFIESYHDMVKLFLLNSHQVSKHMELKTGMGDKRSTKMKSNPYK